MKEALFYQKLANNQVQCQLCHHFCKINDWQRGLCGVRENQKGILQSLVYGKVIAANVDPIEKKPLYHFLPGSKSFSIATVGCNFSCVNCQNADISQASKEGVAFERQEIPGEELSADQIIDQATAADCQSVSYTYTEPTIFFEFALDCMQLAHQRNLKNIWVSNGYTSLAALKEVKPYLDAVNIDLKFFSEKNYKKICGAKLSPILENLVWYKKNNIWLEITTLIIPGLNDSDKELKAIAKFIKNKLGADTPWHISAFFPTYKLMESPPTPTATIKKAWSIGKKVGLHYVYGGNILSPEMSETVCPKCGKMLIGRVGYQIRRLDVDKKCPNCGQEIKLITHD